MEKILNVNIGSCKPLLSPDDLKSEISVSDSAYQTVITGRKTIKKILDKEDSRIIAIVGPCSVHDYNCAMEYAKELKKLQDRYKEKIVVVMRVYFEKPRTTVGWKGMILDPYMDGSCDIEEGLRRGRKLLADINNLGLPCATEALDPIVPQYNSDLISWAAIGARTTESQTHREMSSGLSMPVGFKNGTDGSIKTAIDALIASNHSHTFIGIDQVGQTSVLKTKGNKYGHVILRGGRNGSNYGAKNILETEELLEASKLNSSIIVDCSHANSDKNYKNQGKVIKSIIAQKQSGNSSIIGFMLESNLKEGNQKIGDDLSKLEYGVSVTDQCISISETEELLDLVYRSI
ncbi:3-deoxy-7-phosphoheptulonate synthase [Thiospirochaeta perfilievii]|uniref:Phospho-2-dehydro-3-deoxyheptonate aldolase n=1 Tax=Thiospirochaeta perfilievii TaxID=252967 RepID=A0A5C1Q5Z3_9SPIO|nr:3-deoxy-7-phosphoheptulonate synthase [Thiospirochaeta perfilievii]QEN03483.1 3-deoxy-7-phosphoheptulonate synthase [Thiospirochaeta perfilievii]